MPSLTTVSSWQRRIQRAQQLLSQYAFASELLRFYIQLAQFQQDLCQRVVKTIGQQSVSGFPEELGEAELSILSPAFKPFLVIVEQHGPSQVAERSRMLAKESEPSWRDLLNRAWKRQSPSMPEEFLALMFLQPYAEHLRSEESERRNKAEAARCPYCLRQPGLGVLRQMGDGSARSLVCGFCLAEWEFRRIVCPGCGEENSQQLTVYTADTFDYIRVECCESCKTYIKSIDLTKNGAAEPVVDEIASAPLDLWATERGYIKLQRNLLGI